MAFIEYYNQKRKEFEDCNLFKVIKDGNNPIVWPDSSGVYAIWEIVPNGENKLIYIGMTGKFTKNSEDGTVSFNNASFRSRKGRWTPYRFCENIKDKKKYHFGYGPKYSNEEKQRSNRYNHDAYGNYIQYTSLEIHCFHIDCNHKSYTPLLLETELLTKYLKTEGNLPPANNSL